MPVASAELPAVGVRPPEGRVTKHDQIPLVLSSCKFEQLLSCDCWKTTVTSPACEYALMSFNCTVNWVSLVTSALAGCTDTIFGASFQMYENKNEAVRSGFETDEIVTVLVG